MPRSRSFRSSCIALAVIAGALPIDRALGSVKSPAKREGEVAADNALVYFMREPRFMARARTMFLYSDDQLAGTVDNNCYTFASLPPGKHLLWLNWAKANLEVELEPGKTYWYNVFDQIRPIEESFGRALLEGLEAYCTPTDEERRTSAKHIAERFDKAQRVAAKKPENEPDATARKRREQNVAKWPRVEIASCDVLVVEDFAMADPKAGQRKKDYLVESAPARLADQVVDALPDDLFGEVLRAPESPPTGALVLRGSITQYKPGSETARFLVAGAGAAHLEMELELRSADSGATLARLPVDRTWAFGGAAGAARGIEAMERNVAYELALYLQRGCAGVATGGAAVENPQG